jgi:tetratricopeptide (TPR) repeat protein
VAGTTLQEEARAVLRLVDTDPARATVLAARVCAAAARAGDATAGAVAGRATGLASLHLGRIDAAVRQLQAAVATATRTGSASLVAETRMSLAFALARHGRSAAALQTITEAVADLDGVLRARALAQRGAVEQQLEQLEPALADYRSALPVLRSAGDWVWVQRVHGNRGVLYIYRAQLAAAEAELMQARRLCATHRLDLQLAFVVENLAFLHIRRGDVPTALRFLDEAERRHAALGARSGTVLLDRSELLLAVGLAAEARESAQAALAELTRTRRHSARPQGLLLLGEACLLAGDVPAARRAALAAAAAARRQQRPELAVLARQLAVRCRLAATGRAGMSVPAIAELAQTLEDNGWCVPALDTRLLAAQVALGKGDVQRARGLLRRSSSGRRHGSVELRARAWHAEALLRLAERRPRAALSALGAGVRLVEEHQATLGATDLRSAVSGHRAGLVELGLELCLQVGRARDVLTWAERGRATALLTRPVRPPEDPRLAQLLVELRGTVAELDTARRAARSTEALVRRQAVLERAVREQARQSPQPGSQVLRPRADELVAELGELALVEYVEHQGRLLAVTAAGGRVRLWRLGTAAAAVRSAEHLPLVLQRLARGCRPSRGTEGARQLLGDLASSLDDVLLAPLRRELADRPLVVVPSGRLQSIPWGVLPTCAGRPVTVTPSAALWHRARTRAPRPGGVLAVAGPDLPAAGAEAAAVARAHPCAQVLADGEATTAAVAAALPAAATAHFAVHGRFRSDNALFSSLRLCDGPLTVYDLEALPGVPDLVVLAACDAARSLVCRGDEVLGLAAAFLTLGASTLVASLVPIADAESVPLMTALHQRLSAGAPPARALAELQRQAAESGTPAQLAAAAGLLCLGVDRGAVRLPEQGGPVPLRRTPALR